MEEREEHGGLEIDEDVDFQHLSWKLERVGWMIMGGVLLAGFLGLLGGAGPFRDVTVASGDGSLRVTTMRFSRLWAPGSLEVWLRDPRPDKDGGLAVMIDRTLFDAFRLENIVPEPESALVSGGTVVYRFAVRAGEPAVIRFSIVGDRMGFPSGTVRLVGGTPVRLKLVVYP